MAAPRIESQERIVLVGAAVGGGARPGPKLWLGDQTSPQRIQLDCSAMLPRGASGREGKNSIVLATRARLIGERHSNSRHTVRGSSSVPQLIPQPS
jgi:hypothetical protein